MPQPKLGISLMTGLSNTLGLFCGMTVSVVLNFLQSFQKTTERPVHVSPHWIGWSLTTVDGLRPSENAVPESTNMQEQWTDSLLLAAAPIPSAVPMRSLTGSRSLTGR